MTILTFVISHKYFSRFFVCLLIFMVAFAMSKFKNFVESDNQLFPLWLLLWLKFLKRTLLSCFLFFLPLVLFSLLTSEERGGRHGQVQEQVHFLFVIFLSGLTPPLL